CHSSCLLHLSYFHVRFPHPLPTRRSSDLAGHATTEIATGSDINSAMQELTWEEGEVAVVGSSRLAVPGRLFISSKASRILRSIPVPMIVVPAGYMKADESPGSSTPPSPRKDDEL